MGSQFNIFSAFQQNYFENCPSTTVVWYAIINASSVHSCCKNFYYKIA